MPTPSEADPWEHLVETRDALVARLPGVVSYAGRPIQHMSPDEMVVAIRDLRAVLDRHGRERAG